MGEYDSYKEELIKELLEYDTLEEARKQHLISTMEMAMELAKKYGVDVKETMMAAIFHDIAKIYSKEEMFKYCDENNLEVDEYEKKNPQVLHAKVSADMVRKKYSKSENVYNSILNHTIGRSGMTTMEKIVFVSDKCEYSRRYDRANDYRKELEKGLDEAILMMINDTLKMLIENNRDISIQNVKCRNFIIEEIEKKRNL